MTWAAIISGLVLAALLLLLGPSGFIIWLWLMFFMVIAPLGAVALQWIQNLDHPRRH